jgi:hypothetical protein
MQTSLRETLRYNTYEVEVRSETLRANALFRVGTVVYGGERHKITTGAGIVTSQRFGGVVGIDDTVLVRHDGGESFFY